MPISTVQILKYIQQCYVKWFCTISSLGAPEKLTFKIKHFKHVQQRSVDTYRVVSIPKIISSTQKITVS